MCICRRYVGGDLRPPEEIQHFLSVLLHEADGEQRIKRRDPREDARGCYNDLAECLDAKEQHEECSGQRNDVEDQRQKSLKPVICTAKFVESDAASYWTKCYLKKENSIQLAVHRDHAVGHNR